MSGAYAPQPYFMYSDDDFASCPMSGTGYASTLPVDGPDEVIARLHEAVKDVTGKDVERPAPAKIGFL